LLGFLKQRQRKMLKDRAQQVVLAIATFDAQGKLLVSQSGLMPCQTITRQFHQRVSFEDLHCRQVDGLTNADLRRRVQHIAPGIPMDISSF
jgi:hypothetical protein